MTDGKLYILAFMVLMLIPFTITAYAQIPNTGNNNPYALPDDHRGNSADLDREKPTLIWCPTGPWTVDEDITLNLSMHDNNEFSVINYTIAGITFDLLNNSVNNIAVPLGYYPGTLYVADEWGNYENRYGYGINFTTPSVVTINMIYQEDQADTYSCRGFEGYDWFLPPAYAASQQFSQLTITAGNATDQLQQAQLELEALRVELAILEAELLLKQESEYTESYITNLNATHQAEIDAIIVEVNATLVLVGEVKEDVRHVLAYCR